MSSWKSFSMWSCHIKYLTSTTGGEKGTLVGCLKKRDERLKQKDTPLLGYAFLMQKPSSLQSHSQPYLGKAAPFPTLQRPWLRVPERPRPEQSRACRTASLPFPGRVRGGGTERSDSGLGGHRT